MDKPVTYPYIIKSQLYLAIIIAAPFAIVAGFALWTESAFRILLYPTVMFAIFYTYLWRHRVTLKEDCLINRTLFNTYIIPYKDIVNANIVLQIGGKPPYQMRIFHNNGQTKNPVIVNIKLFSRENLKILTDVLFKKAPHAKFDAAIKKMNEGYMPSLFFPQKY